MSNADKLFEELGFLMEVRDGEIDYIKKMDVNYDKVITFWINAQMVCVLNRRKEIQVFPIFADMQELKAINKKCKELGWSDE